MIEPGARRPLTVDEVLAMDAAGIFHPDERFELIDGALRYRGTISPPHASTVTRLTSIMYRAFRHEIDADLLTIRTQSPVCISPVSLLIPDISLVRHKPDGYRDAHPTAAGVHLLLEVADTSLAYDRDVKLPRYAEADVREVWIIDLNESVVHVHRDPSGDSYLSHTPVDPEGDLTALAFPILYLSAKQIFR